MSDSPKKVLFLDRDGPINLTGPKNFVPDPQFFHFTDGIKEVCKEAQDKGYRIAIITNQTGIGENYYTLADMKRVHAYMVDEFDKAGVKIDEILYTTQKSDPNRKPSPGMFNQIKEKWELSDDDMHHSIAIGDRCKDAQAALLAGVGNVLWYLTEHCLGNDYKPAIREMPNPEKDLKKMKEVVQTFSVLGELFDLKKEREQMRRVAFQKPIQRLAFFTHMKQLEGRL